MTGRCFEEDNHTGKSEQDVSTAYRKIENINRTLLNLSTLISTCGTVEELFPSIHRSLSEIIDVTNFYVAIYDEHLDTITFPYNVDVKEVDCPPLVHVSQRDSLTARVITTRRPLLITRDEIIQQQRDTGGTVTVGVIPEIWLGVPLITNRTVIGAMAVQSYETQGYYDLNDMEVLNSIAAQVAMAIEQKQAESSLRAANAKFAAAMDSLDAMVYVADMTTYELLFMNTRTQKAFGASLGGKCWQVIQHDQSGPCPFCTNDILLQADGKPGPTHVWEFENTKNSRWYQCRDKAIQWPDGRVVRLEIAFDITERKLIETQLRESELRFRALHDASFGGVDSHLTIH